MGVTHGVTPVTFAQAWQDAGRRLITAIIHDPGQGGKIRRMTPYNLHRHLDHYFHTCHLVIGATVGLSVVAIAARVIYAWAT